MNMLPSVLALRPTTTVVHARAAGARQLAATTTSSKPAPVGLDQRCAVQAATPFHPPMGETREQEG